MTNLEIMAYLRSVGVPLKSSMVSTDCAEIFEIEARNE